METTPRRDYLAEAKKHYDDAIGEMAKGAINGPVEDLLKAAHVAAILHDCDRVDDTNDLLQMAVQHSAKAVGAPVPVFGTKEVGGDD